ncbi:MAG: FAD-dependent oxidoreductase, partial [Nitrososphaeraceae archaeon]
EIAHKELGSYPSVIYAKREVTSVTKNNNDKQLFELVTSENERYQSKTIIISTGLKDVLPNIDNISDYYGKSLFHCLYCDGWELRDKPLVVIIGEQVQGFHFIQTIYNWSKDLIVCTNNGEALWTDRKDNL